MATSRADGLLWLFCSEAIDNIRLSRFRSTDYLTLLLTNRETYGKGLGAIISFTKPETSL